MNEPLDIGIRDAIRTERERNVVVEASAGTGKTTLLISRVLSLIDGGIPLDRICVVTFTKSAASELRTRLRAALGDAAGSLLPGAWIDTIHGFASRFLREYSHLTGVDPAFTVCASRFTPLEIKRKWDGYITGLSREELASSDLLIRLAKTTSLLKLARDIEDQRWITSTSCFGSSRDVLSEFLVRSLPTLERLLPLCSDHTDELYSRIQSTTEYLSTLTAVPVSPFRQKLASSGAGKQANWGGKECLAEVKENYRVVIDEWVKRVFPVLACAGIEDQIEHLLMPFVRSLRREWSDDRARQSYDDLLLNTWDLLQSSALLLSLAADRFDHVLIDEFQDTSRLQTGIFSSFLAEAGRILPGKLTVVGDRKQSIFGWRFADIETYGDTVNTLEASGALSETITVNFRSTRKIIRFVNAMGKALFEQQTPEELPFGCDYSPLEPAPEACEGIPVEILDIPPKPDDIGISLGEPAWAARCQAEYIAEKARSEMGSTSCRWGDFALLIRSATHLDQFINVFEREGIPYSVEASRDFRKLTEAADIAEMIRCLVCPEDRKAWVHTLRSAFFGIDDIDISRVMEENNPGYMSEHENCPPPISCANDILRRLRESALCLPLKDFLTVLFYETDLLAVITASGYQVSRRLSGLQYILDIAFTGNARSLSDLLIILDKDLAPAATEEPVTLPEEGDALVVTTIHRAKGLAFKHVFLAALNQSRSPGTDNLLTNERDDRAAFYFSKTAVTAHWPDLVSREKARSNAEMRRLLYVAATRAKDSLTIFRVSPKRSISPALILHDAVQAAIESDPGCCNVSGLAPVLPSPTAHSLPYTPGETGLPAACNTYFPVTIREVDRTPEKILGTVVHAILEKIDVESPNEWIEEHTGTLRASFPDLFDEAKNLALSLFDTDLPFELTGSGIIGREFCYMVSTPEGARTRYIDLLFDDGERLIVLDYKTDHVSGGDLEAAAEPYLETQAFYGADVARIYGKPVSCFIAFLREKACFHVGDY
jgi:ATP-dependent helicase/nuclease subunit A